MPLLSARMFHLYYIFAEVIDLESSVVVLTPAALYLKQCSLVIAFARGGRSAVLKSSQMIWYSDVREAEYDGRFKFFGVRGRTTEVGRQFPVLTALGKNE